MSSPRLLALTTAQEDGGAESHLRATLAAARERGYDIHVALPRSAQTVRLWNDLERAGYKTHAMALGVQGASRAGAYAAILRDLLITLFGIVRVRPHMILANVPTQEATPGAMAACALSRVPTTVIFHLVRSDLRVTRRRRLLYQWIARSSQLWVCVSGHNRAVLAREFGVGLDRIEIARHGVAHQVVPPGARERIRVELGIAPDATLVLTTGRLSVQKEHRLIIDALPLMLAFDERLVFAWAGDGPLQEALTSRLAAAGLGAHVLLLGRREDVPELLAASDLFLMPSRDEGGAPPFALAEAMHAGVPVVVSDAGSLVEVIHDRRNGLVFKRGDADDLARAMEWAATNRAELAEMAARARQQAESELTVEHMTARILSYLGDPARSSGAADGV